MSAASNKELARRYTEEMWGHGDLEVGDAIFTSDFRDHTLMIGQGPGLEGLKQLIRTVRAAVPDYWAHVEQILADGDYVVLRWSSSGTHSAAFMGVPATGKRITFTGIDIYRVAGGQLAERWDEWNSGEVLAQLGLVPAAPQAGG